MNNLLIINNLNLMFSFIMVISSIMTISSSNWLGMWMGLEMNMISFIPLIMNTKNILSNESALKYFLVQTIASCFFLMCCLMNSLYSSWFSNIMMESQMNMLMIAPIMMKLGSAPFHAWFVMVMEGMNWVKCLLLMTWQKIAPIFILLYINSTMFIIPFIVSSLIMGALGGLNQTSLKKIMAYSSINHLGWIMTAIMLNKFILIFYLIMYLFMNIYTVMNFIKNNLNTFNQFFFKTDLNFIISIMSLAGLPPLLGFLPKWLIINKLVYTSNYFLLMLMIMMALVTIFFYMRMILNSFIMTSWSPTWMLISWNKSSFLNKLFMATSVISILMFNLT